MAERLTLVCLCIAAIVAVVYGDQCNREFGGVCISMTMGYCPFTSGTFSWIGCASGDICCIPKKEEPASTEPPKLQKECGVRQVGSDGAFRIVGGYNATVGAWPWVVSIEYDEKEDPHLCGAALINDRWLVTASHCFMDSQDPAQYRVVIGQHDRQTHIKEREQIIPVEIILLHEDFNSPYKANDIALVRLKEPVQFGDFAQPVCLPEKEDDFEGDVCTVVGWGVPNMYTVDQLMILQEVNLPILPRDDCVKRVFPFHETNICAGYKYGGKDACGGDSGGPLMCQKVGSNQWRLVGVISWGNGCARPENPGVYTHVTKFLDWINNMVEE